MFTDAKYANEMFSDYGLLICSFNSSNGVQTVSSGSVLTFNKKKSVGNDESNLFGVSYGDDYSTEPFQACKVDKYLNPLEISAEEYSQIVRWLTRKGFHEFKINSDGYENIRWFGSFTIQPIKINEITYGIECTLTTNSPYAYSDENNILVAGKTFTVFSTSDEEGEIYPDVEITCLESGTLRIENSLDNETFIILNCSQNEVITINHQNKIPISSLDTHNITNDFNYNYLKLVNKYNDRVNTYTSSLNIKMILKYSPVRKVGI